MSLAIAMTILRMFSACCSSAVVKASLRQLGDAVDQQRYFVAELLAHHVDGHAGVLDHVVQQSGHQRGSVEPEVSADAGRADRVVDVGLTARPELRRVLGRRHLKGTGEQVAVERGVVLSDLLEELRKRLRDLF